MKTANEILNNAPCEVHGLDYFYGFQTIKNVIEKAQKEAYNEAIRDAAKNAEADSRWEKDDEEEPTPFVIKKSILKLLK